MLWIEVALGRKLRESLVFHNAGIGASRVGITLRSPRRFSASPRFKIFLGGDQRHIVEFAENCRGERGGEGVASGCGPRVS